MENQSPSVSANKRETAVIDGLCVVGNGRPRVFQESVPRTPLLVHLHDFLYLTAHLGRYVGGARGKWFCTAFPILCNIVKKPLHRGYLDDLSPDYSIRQFSRTRGSLILAFLPS